MGSGDSSPRLLVISAYRMLYSEHNSREVKMMKLSEKILYCRKRAGLSQEALAERLGVSRQAVSKWETGEAMPETGKLAALASALGVSVDWLLSEDEPEEARAQSGDWTEGLPRMIGRMAKRWGWLAGVYMAVVGALFAGLGLLARSITSRMFDAFDTGLGYDSGFGMMGGFSDTMGSIAQNNPVSIMGGAIAVFGGVLFIAGIVLAIWLKRRSRR